MTTSSDQAAKLRRDASAGRSGLLPGGCLPAIAITGGKGGVGKTAIATNLSVLLRRFGLDPLRIDLDMGLANADVLLGVNPQATLFDIVIGGQAL
ncbi:MAG: AAA family ATPase, partial [Planctomycetota bacterium]